MAETEGQDLFRDTTITAIERRGEVFVEHYYSYDSLGQIDFETAHVTTYDTAYSKLTASARGSGRSFLFKGYAVWTPSTSSDTFDVMTSKVRAGEFLCFRDTTSVHDALIIERRTEGYGTYRNAGFLVIPSAQDTIPIWSLVDRGLARPIVWDWDGLVPMTLEEYQEEKIRFEKFAASLSSKEDLDSLLNRVR